MTNPEDLRRRLTEALGESKQRELGLKEEVGKLRGAMTEQELRLQRLEKVTRSRIADANVDNLRREPEVTDSDKSDSGTLSEKHQTDGGGTPMKTDQVWSGAMRDPFPEIRGLGSDRTARAMIWLVVPITFFGLEKKISSNLQLLLIALGELIFKLYEREDKHWCRQYLAGEKREEDILAMHEQYEKRYPALIPYYLDKPGRFLMRMGKKFFHLAKSLDAPDDEYPSDSAIFIRVGNEIEYDYDSGDSQILDASLSETWDFMSLPPEFEDDIKNRISAFRTFFEEESPDEYDEAASRESSGSVDDDVDDLFCDSAEVAMSEREFAFASEEERRAHLDKVKEEEEQAEESFKRILQVEQEKETTKRLKAEAKERKKQWDEYRAQVEHLREQAVLSAQVNLEESGALDKNWHFEIVDPDGVKQRFEGSVLRPDPLDAWPEEDSSPAMSDTTIVAQLTQSRLDRVTRPLGQQDTPAPSALDLKTQKLPGRQVGDLASAKTRTRINVQADVNTSTGEGSTSMTTKSSQQAIPRISVREITMDENADSGEMEVTSRRDAEALPLDIFVSIDGEQDVVGVDDHKRGYTLANGQCEQIICLRDDNDRIYQHPLVVDPADVSLSDLDVDDGEGSLEELAGDIGGEVVKPEAVEEEQELIECLGGEESEQSAEQVDEVKTDETKPEDKPEAKVDEAKLEEPKAEEPKLEEPKAEEPKLEEQAKAEEPKLEEPKLEEPKAEEPKLEEQAKAEEPKLEEPKLEEQPEAEEPKLEEPKAEEPKLEEPKAEEPKLEEPKLEEPEAEEQGESGQEIADLFQAMDEESEAMDEEPEAKTEETEAKTEETETKTEEEEVPNGASSADFAEQLPNPEEEAPEDTPAEASAVADAEVDDLFKDDPLDEPKGDEADAKELAKAKAEAAKDAEARAKADMAKVKAEAAKNAEAQAKADEAVAFAEQMKEEFPEPEMSPGLIEYTLGDDGSKTDVNGEVVRHPLSDCMLASSSDRVDSYDPVSRQFKDVHGAFGTEVVIAIDGAFHYFRLAPENVAAAGGGGGRFNQVRGALWGNRGTKSRFGLIVALILLGTWGVWSALPSNTENHAPTLAALDNVSVKAGEKLEIQLIGADEDETDKENLSYSVNPQLPGATLDSKTGLYTWSPAANLPPGTHQVTFSVTDGHGGDPVTQQVAISVTAPPRGRLKAWEPNSPAQELQIQKWKLDGETTWRDLTDEQMIQVADLGQADTAVVASLNALLKDLVDVKSEVWDRNAGVAVIRWQFNRAGNERVLPGRETMGPQEAARYLSSKRIGYVIFELRVDNELTESNPYKFERSSVQFRPHPQTGAPTPMFIVPGTRFGDAPAQPRAFWELLVEPPSSIN